MSGLSSERPQATARTGPARDVPNHQSIYDWADGIIPRRPTLERIAALHFATVDDLLAGRVDAEGKFRDRKAAYLAALPRQGPGLYTSGDLLVTLDTPPGVVLSVVGFPPGDASGKEPPRSPLDIQTSFDSSAGPTIPNATRTDPDKLGS